MIVTANGASGAVVGACPDVPKCMHNGMPASSAAANSGSQWSVWNEGRPRAWGISVKVMPLAPFAATRAASLTVASMSQKGMSTNGIWRPGIDAHHSSIIQSL